MATLDSRSVRLSLFGSGAGSTVAAILDAVADGRIAADPALVIGNNSGAGVLAIAAAHGVPVAHLSGATNPDPDDLDVGHARCQFVDSQFQTSSLPPAHEAAQPRSPALHNGDRTCAACSAYGGQGMYGDRVHAAVLADGAPTGASVHVVTEEYDEGPVLAQVEVPVLPGDSVETLRARVQAAEKALLIDWLGEWSRG